MRSVVLSPAAALSRACGLAALGLFVAQLVGCAPTAEELAEQGREAVRVMTEAQAAGRHGENLTARRRVVDLGTASVPAVLDLFHSSDRLVQALGVEVIVEIGPIAVPAVAKLANAGGEQEQANAIAVFARLADRQSRVALASLLDSANPAVRTKAARALARLGDRSGLAHLVTALRSPRADTRYTAVLELGLVARPECLIPLVLALEDASGMVRLGAIQSLGHLADPRAVSSLTEMKDGDPIPEIRREAALTLANITREKQIYLDQHRRNRSVTPGS
ncbi:MAG: HEAT repeat domain-containing protein [Candidatus Schekmanbacteria bacterium]|nr:HEAT repeat domain-containing protein [Candidatus Schekmanbacteria bacterium]